MPSPKRRREMATFLRTRRMLRQPEELGLPRGPRRRTPGLRREEVAATAGLSAEWYTWLEQARDVHPSPEVLQRIAAALRLDPAEYRHLLTLAGYAFPESGGGPPRAESISFRLQRLLDQLEYCPAWAMGERLDVLGWNRAAAVVHGDFTALRGIERNALYQFFLVKAVRPMMLDWEEQTQCCTAALRAAYASRVDDPWFDELIHVLRTRSPEFDRQWDAHGLEVCTEGTHTYQHPTAGRLVFDYTMMDVLDERLAPVRLVTYVPAPGTGTRKKMEQLVEAALPVPFSLVAT